MNFIRNQKEELHQLEEYMNIIGNEFMQMSLKVMEKLRVKIRIKENKKIHKITKFPDTNELESLVNSKSLESFGVKAPLSSPNSFPPKQLCVKYVRTILPSPPLVRESTFGFKPSTKNNQNVKFRQDGEKPLQFLLSFEFPSVDEPEPQLLPNSSPLNVNLGDERGPNHPSNHIVRIVLGGR
ncbi:hypothetical protein Tco_0301018 [Tanacetum coccineum]